MPTSLEIVKAQARVVIPIVKALEQELGRESAHALVGGAIADSWADFVVSRSAEIDSHPNAGSLGFEFPVESEVVEDSDDRFGRNFTACAFADYFRRIGEPEIGSLLTCGVDFAVEERLRPGWEFTRTQTRMQGAAHCNFRWRRKESAEE